jgi:hypothetical protein
MEAQLWTFYCSSQVPERPPEQYFSRTAITLCISLQRSNFDGSTSIQASGDLLLAQSKDTVLYEDYLRIISFEYRRRREFLGPAEESINPFFGLNNRHVLEALKATEDNDCGVDFLRPVAQASGLGPGDAIILCGHREEFESSD